MTHLLDVRRLLCPMPVIRLGEQIEKIPSGHRVKIRATDPGVLHDIPAWCSVHGHRVLESRTEQDEIIVLVEKQ